MTHHVVLTLTPAVLPRDVSLFGSGVLFYHVVDAIAILTVIVTASVLQVKLGRKWWGPINDMEAPLVLVLVELWRRSVRRGEDTQLGFIVLCIVAIFHWLTRTGQV